MLVSSKVSISLCIQDKRSKISISLCNRDNPLQLSHNLLPDRIHRIFRKEMMQPAFLLLAHYAIIGNFLKKSIKKSEKHSDFKVRSIVSSFSWYLLPPWKLSLRDTHETSPTKYPSFSKSLPIFSSFLKNPEDAVLWEHAFAEHDLFSNRNPFIGNITLSRPQTSIDATEM